MKIKDIKRKSFIWKINAIYNIRNISGNSESLHHDIVKGGKKCCISVIFISNLAKDDQVKTISIVCDTQSYVIIKMVR